MKVKVKAIHKLLVANRGEIAVRVMRACAAMNIRTVAVYSVADKDALHVKLADEAYCIGPNASSDSYLNIANIISCALNTSCDAIHPGVGFLSENATFAREVLRNGLIWVGPHPEVIELLGDKVSAKQTAKKYKIPCTPGSDGAIANTKEASLFAQKAGYPVLIKASSGGGGKGMRLVREESSLEGALQLAMSEAEKAYGDKSVYIEKFLEKPSHVEIQVIGDQYGNVVHLGERDCSFQKNYQKVVEETPSPNISQHLRKELCESAVKLFKALNYVNAGTVEFLVEGNSYYFMEVNTRIQVEHPITEMVSGIDLIQEQIRVASGEELSFTQNDIKLGNYALECRINALSAGKVKEIFFPSGFQVRVDSFLYDNCFVVPFYDSMLAKVIVGAKTRQKGIQKMLAVLKELKIEGINTNIERQKRLLQNPLFKKGSFSIKAYEQIAKEIEV